MIKLSEMDKVNQVLNRGVEAVYPSKEALKKVLDSGKKIKLYQGFDPSMPNLHLGNLVGILKLKQFQDLGHKVIFLVGDFTGMIGDPTDKTAVRKRLTRKQVQINSQAWQKQASRILKFSGKNPVKWLFNSQWLDKTSFKDLINTTSYFTVQQILERNFFQKRVKEGKPIFLHEFLYPVAQAIDCVEMDVDLEVGGNDQTFNMLAGRTLMKAVKGKEKFVLATKLLVDSKGEKVGKTAGNALFLNASAADMFGGVMSFPDEVIPLAFELLTEVPFEKIKTIENDLKNQPMNLKKQLAFEIVKLNHGLKSAQQAQEEFEKVFQKREFPQKAKVFETRKNHQSLIDLLIEIKLVSSRSEAKRLIFQGGVDVDGESLKDPQAKVELKNGLTIRVGKRKFVKIEKS